MDSNQTPPVKEQVLIWFEMSQGEESKMYTLWRCISSKLIYRRVFQKNLSTEHSQAIVKAKELAGDYELIDDSLDELKKITRGPDVIRFGKYKDKHLSELPDGYLLWVAQGAQVPDEESRERYSNNTDTTSLIGMDSVLKGLAEKEAEKRGLYREFEGKLLPLSLITYIENSRIGRGHHFTNGEKVKDLKATCIKTTGFETAYGYTSVYVFRTDDNKQITYKGSELHFKDKRVSYYEGGINFPKFEKGSTCLLSGTIEHSTYREENITNIKRPKITLSPEDLKKFREEERQSVEEFAKEMKEWKDKEEEREKECQRNRDAVEAQRRIHEGLTNQTV